MSAGDPEQWPVPGLIAAMDAGIADRILAAHPGVGWCGLCHATAPCSLRQLGLAVDAAGRILRDGHED